MKNIGDLVELKGDKYKVINTSERWLYLYNFSNNQTLRIARTVLEKLIDPTYKSRCIGTTRHKDFYGRKIA